MKYLIGLVAALLTSLVMGGGAVDSVNSFWENMPPFMALCVFFAYMAWKDRNK